MPSLLIDIGANIARLQQDMAKAQGQITTFAKSTERAFSSLGTMVASAGITVGVQSMVQAFMDAERATMKMAVAMRNQGDYSRRALEDLKDFAAQMQRTTAAEDDATLAVMANLKTYGMTNEELKRSTKAVLDLAAAKQDEGVTTERASEVIGRAYLGQTTALKRLGIVIGDNIPQGEKFNTVMSQIEQRFGGAAAAELETYSGQWKKIKNDFNDVAEVVGIGLLKGLEGAMFGFSMVSVAFYRTLEAVSSGIGWFYEQIGKGASLVGLNSVAQGASAIAAQMNSSAGGYTAIKEEALRMADANWKAMTSFDNVDRAVTKMRSGTRTTPPADTKAAEEAAKRFQKDYIEGIEVIARAADATAKQTEEQMKWFADLEEDKVKALEKENAAWIKAGESAVDGMEKEIALGVSISKQSLDRIDQRMRAERDMYEDMRGFEQDYYTSVKLMIDSQAQKYRDLGINETLIEKWAQGEKLKAFDAYVDKAGTLYQRLEKRTRKYAEDAGDMHKMLFESIDAGAKNLQEQMSDNFFDALTGNFQRVQLDWDSMWNAMARSAANSMAQLAATKFINPAINAGAGFLGSALGSGLEWLSEAVGGFSGVLDWVGLSAGQYLVDKDKLALLHQGEMVLPADYAQMLRDLMESSGGYAGPQSGFAMEPGSVVGPNMGGLMAGQLGSSVSKGASLGALSGLFAGGPYGALVGGVVGGGRGLVVGTIMDIAHALGLTDLGKMAGLRDDIGLPDLGFSGLSDMMSGRTGIGMDMGGYEANYGGGGFGDPTGDMGGPGGEPGGDDGWRWGGISAGPSSGHRETLHGTEAVVPLPDGRTIPVEMKNGGGDLPPVRIILQVDGRELGDVLFRLTRSGAKVIHQNGITAI